MGSTVFSLNNYIKKLSNIQGCPPRMRLLRWLYRQFKFLTVVPEVSSCTWVTLYYTYFISFWSWISWFLSSLWWRSFVLNQMSLSFTVNRFLVLEKSSFSAKMAPNPFFTSRDAATFPSFNSLINIEINQN